MTFITDPKHENTNINITYMVSDDTLKTRFPIQFEKPKFQLLSSRSMAI